MPFSFINSHSLCDGTVVLTDSDIGLVSCPGPQQKNALKQIFQTIAFYL